MKVVVLNVVPIVTCVTSPKLHECTSTGIPTKQLSFCHVWLITPEHRLQLVRHLNSICTCVVHFSRHLHFLFAECLKTQQTHFDI